ncbi:MAG: lamin tail domain-containing protein, partial [bacterium]
TIVRIDPMVDTDTYADWTYAVNNGNPQTQMEQGNILFSEIFYDTPGTDSIEEWIELYNKSSFDVNIAGWSIVDNNGAGYTFTFPAGTSIAPGTYLTVAIDSAGFAALYGYEADVYGNLPSLNNSGDTLILKDSLDNVKDFVAWEGGASAGIPDGWGSTSDPWASTGRTIVRIDPMVDTDTYADWTYAVNNGNPETQLMGMPDTSPPEPDVFPLPDAVGECSAEIVTVPTATDDYSGSIAGTTTDPLIYTEQGTHTVTWTYDDGNGNSVTQTQTVIVQDVTAPVPDAATLPTVAGECSAEISAIPTATDNCSGTITGTTTDPLSFTEQGTHTVTWTYDDGNGNTATQTQTVTVEDVRPPEIHLSVSTCVRRWQLANMLTISASDNCSSEVELIIDKVEIFKTGGRRVLVSGVYSLVGNDIYVFPRGRDLSVYVTATAVDANGNTKTEKISKSLLKKSLIWDSLRYSFSKYYYKIVQKYKKILYKGYLYPYFKDKKTGV